MILKRLLMSTPLFIGAGAISFHYLTASNYDHIHDLFNDALVNTVVAVVVVALLSIAWRPSPFLKIVTITVILTAIGNAFLFPLMSFPVVVIAGYVEQDLNYSAFLSITFSWGIISSSCALGTCLIFDATRFIRGINWRSYGTCAGLCFLAGVPLTLDAPANFALHKFVWIVLLGVGLCLTVDDNRDSVLGQLVEEKRQLE